MNPDILAPLVRILLRYIGGALISAGVMVSPDLFTDPDVVQVVCFLLAGLLAVLSEGWWALARRRGWST